MSKESSQVNTLTRAPVWVGVFLDSLRANCNVALACRACGIDRSTPYAYRQDHPEFGEQWDEAIEEGADILEAEAWRRAYEGVDRPVYQGGQEVGVVREYSDTLMQTLLKGHKPEKYRERAKLELTGADGGPLKIERSLSDAELEAIAAGHDQSGSGTTAS